MGTWLNLKAFAQQRKPSIEQKPKQLISYIYIYSSSSSTPKKANGQVKKMGRRTKKIFFQKGKCRWPTDTWKYAQRGYIREMWINTTCVRNKRRCVWNGLSEGRVWELIVETGLLLIFLCYHWTRRCGVGVLLASHCCFQTSFPFPSLKQDQFLISCQQTNIFTTLSLWNHNEEK